MIIGFTGSQSGMTPFQHDEFIKLLNEFNPDEFHYGDCIGADAIAAREFIAFHLKLEDKIRKLVCHPPTDNYKRAYVIENMKSVVKDALRNCKYKLVIESREPFKYLERNRHIAETCHTLIATPKEFEHTLRSGTWATVRYSWRLKKNTIIIPPLVRDTI